MTIETKEVSESVYQEYCYFGWQFSQMVRGGGRGAHRTHAILVQNKDMLHYDEMQKLETEYMNLRSKLKKYERPDFSTYVILFLLFILPGILFAVYQSGKKSRIEEHNEEIEGKMDAIRRKAETLQ